MLARPLSHSDMVSPGAASPAVPRRTVEYSNVLAGLRNKVVRPSRLLRVFASLVGSQLGGGVLGLVFWTLVARALTPEQVGIGAALVAAMTLLSTVGVLGISTLLLERFKVVPVTDRRALLSTGFGIAGMGGALVAAGWLGVSALAHFSGVLGDISASSALLLVGTTGIAATCCAFDQAVIAMGASSLQLRRNLVASILRIAVFAGEIALDVRTGQAVLVSWTAGLVGSLLVTPLRRHLPPRTAVTLRQRWHLIRSHWVVAIGHHGLTMAVTSSSLMFPVVVASLMSATETAYFNQARLLEDSVVALPYLLTLALFATAASMDDFRQKAPRTLLMGMVLAVSFFLGGALFGPILLMMFGADYSEKSWPLLLILLALGPASVIKDHFVVLRRLQGKRRQGALTMALWSTAELMGALIGGLAGGVTMLCVGFLAMSTICSVIALPPVIRAMRKQPMADESRRVAPVEERRPYLSDQAGPAKSEFGTCPAAAVSSEAEKHHNEQLGTCKSAPGRTAEMPEFRTSQFNEVRDEDVEISVVMACYTEERLPSIDAAVCSLQRQTLKPRAIIIAVDNNEPLANLLRQRFDQVTVVVNRSNRGASSTRNRGVEEVSTEFTAFLDDDETAHPDWLLELTRPFADPEVVGTGGKYKPAWPTAKPSWFPEEFAWVVGGSYEGLPVVTAPVRNVWSGNMAVRTKAFREVGGFRTNLGKLGSTPEPEDTDLCIRMAAACGGRWMYVPTATIDHIVPRSRASLGFFISRCFAEGRGKAAMVRKLEAVSATAIDTERDYARTAVRVALMRLGSLRWAANLQGIVMLLGLASAASGYLSTFGLFPVIRAKDALKRRETV